MTRKQHIHTLFVNILQQKIILLQNKLAELKESGANETKSTAGDKHETALAMLQIEQENTRKQLENLQLQLASLLKLQPTIVAELVLVGSFVVTNFGNFYISVAAGKVEWQKQVIIAISAAAPIAIALQGKKWKDSFLFNEKKYEVLSIE